MRRTTQGSELVAHLRAICWKATRGPWGFARADRNSGLAPTITVLNDGHASGKGIATMCGPVRIKGTLLDPDDQTYKDARFISTFHPDLVDRLLDVVEAAEAALTYLDGVDVPYVERHRPLHALHEALEAVRECNTESHNSLSVVDRQDLELFRSKDWFSGEEVLASIKEIVAWCSSCHTHRIDYRALERAKEKYGDHE